MPVLDPDDLRAYARRDWTAPERLSRAARAEQPVERKVELAIALYEAARRTTPTPIWEAARREDFEHHRRLKRLLHRARHVGAR